MILMLVSAAAQMAADRLDQLSWEGVRRDSDRPLASSIDPAAADDAPTGIAFRSLSMRLSRLGRRLPLPHYRVARLLFSYPGEHLSLEDVTCLLLLESAFLSRHSVRLWLDELVPWRVIQRIEIDARNTGYDIDTRPHLHVYYPKTRSLHDAPADGVLTAPKRFVRSID